MILTYLPRHSYISDLTHDDAVVPVDEAQMGVAGEVPGSGGSLRLAGTSVSLQRSVGPVTVEVWVCEDRSVRLLVRFIVPFCVDCVLASNSYGINA